MVLPKKRNETTIDDGSALTCCICEKAVNLPKDFPCHHCACQTCLKQYCINHAGERGFPCPKCNVEVRVNDPTKPLVEWIDMFPTNYDKVKKLEKMNMGGLNTKILKCVLCAQKYVTLKATKYCKSCEEYFCDDCGNQHWLLRASKEHRVMFISDMDALQEDMLLRAYLLVIFNAKIKDRNVSRCATKHARIGNSKVAPAIGIDLEDCKITGTTFMENGNILLADQRNGKLKLFDKNYTFRASVEVQCWDVLQLNHSTLVVSCPEERCIKYYTVRGDDIKELRTIHTDDVCYGICVANAKLVAACVGDAINLKTFNDTKVVSSTDVAKGKLSMTLPHYITFDNKTESFIISDSWSKCVKRVNSDGTLVWEKDIRDGKGVEMCGSNLILARNDHNTVDLVNFKGQSLKSIASGEDGLEKAMALSIEHSNTVDNSKRLLVSDESDLVRVFSLEDPTCDDETMNLGDTTESDSGDSISNQQTKTCNIL